MFLASFLTGETRMSWSLHCIPIVRPVARNPRIRIVCGEIISLCKSAVFQVPGQVLRNCLES